MQDGELPDGAMKPGSNDDVYMNDGSGSDEDEEPLLASGVTLPFAVSKHLKSA